MFMDIKLTTRYVSDTIYGSQKEKKPLRICIIGAGAAGLSALKIIKDSEMFQAGACTAVAFEAREDIGGVWYAELQHS